MISKRVCWRALLCDCESDGYEGFGVGSLVVFYGMVVDISGYY